MMYYMIGCRLTMSIDLVCHFPGLSPYSKDIKKLEHDLFQWKIIVKHRFDYLWWKNREAAVIVRFKKTLITSYKDVSIEILEGKISHKNELKTTHREADIIIVQQWYWLIRTGYTSIKITSNDTDVLVIACYLVPNKRN